MPSVGNAAAKVRLRWLMGLGAMGVALSCYMTHQKLQLMYHTGKSATSSNNGYEDSQSGLSLCDLNEYFSCSAINNSSYSMLLGVPVAFYGVLWFSMLVWLSGSCLWELAETGATTTTTTLSDSEQGHSEQQQQHDEHEMAAVRRPWPTAILRGRQEALVMGLVLWCGLGCVFVVYFLLAELAVGAICLLCTGVHVLTAICMGLSLALCRCHPASASRPFFSAASFLAKEKTGLMTSWCVRGHALALVAETCVALKRELLCMTLVAALLVSYFYLQQQQQPPPPSPQATGITTTAASGDGVHSPPEGATAITNTNNNGGGAAASKDLARCLASQHATKLVMYSVVRMTAAHTHTHTHPPTAT